MPPESSPLARGGALTEAVRQCRLAPGFLAALADLLGQAEAALADRQADCRACGDCCRFASAGHRLYASAGEIALLTGTVPPQPPRGLCCPYQVGERCTARSVRPLGCRVFFCRGGPAEEMQGVYERYHAAIRRLHDAAGVGYHYAELTAALRELFSG